NDAFTPVARALLPGATATLQTTLLGLLTNPIGTVAQAQAIVAQLLPTGGIPSAYGVVDNNNVLYINSGNQILALALNVPAVPLLGI
ncbi:hypothetical protein SB778_42345, partial [Paraburkholderia sp. SIMBA_050]